MIKFLIIRKIFVFFVSVFGYLSLFYTENIFAKTISEVECKGTEEKLVYNCIISLTDQKTQKKILGDTLSNVSIRILRYLHNRL